MEIAGKDKSISSDAGYSIRNVSKLIPRSSTSSYVDVTDMVVYGVPHRNDDSP